MAESSSRSLENACALLSLIEDEDEGLVIGNDDIKEVGEEFKFTLVGHLATEKPIKFNVLKDTLALVWSPGKGMNVIEAAPNLFLFQFFHKVDMICILEDGPWPLTRAC